jgi:hypothetical protein
MITSNNFKTRLDSLIKRKTIQPIIYTEGEEISFEQAKFNETLFGLESTLLESISKSQDSNLIKYINQAAEEVNERYTEISYEEGERIQNSLSKDIDDIIFEYQGSVSNNTHIKAASDLDLLVILEKSYPITKENLFFLKNDCHSNIEVRFPKVNIERGAKSLKLTGGSLKRDIDVVPSHWDEMNKDKKGIIILDEDKNEKVTNTPFHHNYLLGKKDSLCNSYYKKSIRLIKNLKVDLENEIGNQINISSYEIVALLYHISNEKFLLLNKNTDLIPMLVKELNLILLRSDLKELKVPDESRKIIKDSATINGLKVIINELTNILNELEEETEMGNITYSSIKSTPKAWGN